MGTRPAEPKAHEQTDPIASIDLGSNTVRLLVASDAGGRIERHLVRQEATRLGQGLRPGGPLLPDAVRRTWKALEDFGKQLSSLGVERVLLGATMAVREAADGPDFMARIEKDLGFETLILSGSQEAALTAAGVMTGLDPVPDRAVIFDLGGRSTEFILTRKGLVEASESIDLGAVALFEAHLSSDPPTRVQVEACRSAAAGILSRGLSGFTAGAGRPLSLVGTAGTTTTLAAMAQRLTVYRPELIDNYRLSRVELGGLFEEMLSRTAAERALMPGLPRDRADIIAAGAAAVIEIMDLFEADKLIVSDAGLLEGIWLAAAGKRSIENGR